MSRITFLVVLLFCFGATAHSQSSMSQLRRDRLGYLKKWAGEYPRDFTVKPHVDFFSLPEVRQPLLRLLGTQNYKRMIDAFGVEAPIDLIDGYLVLQGHNKYSTPAEDVVIAIKLYDGAMHVGFDGNGKPDWYSSKGKYTDLPKCVLGRITN